MNDIQTIKKKLELNKNRLQTVKENQEIAGGPTKHTTFHGGWTLGYYEGKIAALEDVLDILECE
jgi:hypothetical protein